MAEDASGGEAPTRRISLFQTTGVTMTTATIAPTVKWMLTGMAVKDMPDSTPLLVAAAVIIAAHAVEKMLNYYWNKQTNSGPLLDLSVAAAKPGPASQPPGGHMS